MEMDGEERTRLMVCMQCRGEGIPGGCPKCDLDSLLAQPVHEITPEILEVMKIPPVYKGVIWDTELLFAGRRTDEITTSLHKYAELLTRYLDVLKSGRIPETSLLIVAPRMYAKRTFIYCCMQEAIKRGFTTAEVLDTSQYRRMLLIGTERPFTKNKGEPDINSTLEQIHECDILFMTVDILSYRNSYKVMESVFEKRSRRGKPTIMTSRFSPREMAILDYEKDPMRLFDSNRFVDRLKYPNLIMVSDIHK